jgi:hypothetical protein
VYLYIYIYIYINIYIYTYIGSSSGSNNSHAANHDKITQDLKRNASSSCSHDKQSQLDKIYNLEILPFIDRSTEEWSEIFKNEVKSLNIIDENNSNDNRNNTDLNFNLNKNKIEISKVVENSVGLSSAIDPHEASSILGLDIQESVQSSIMINELFSVR